MCHACLVAHEGGEVARLGGVILGEGLYLAAVSLASLARQEPKGSVAGRGEFSVRLKRENSRQDSNRKNAIR